MKIRVSDIRQYLYCPRIPWFKLVAGIPDVLTPSMERGNVSEEEMIRLEKRRLTKRYGLQAAERKYGVWIWDELLEIEGKIDMTLETESSIYPVDFKWTRSPEQQDRSFAQLALYGMMLERKGTKSVTIGFIYLLKQGRIYEVSLTNERKERLLKEVEALKETLIHDTLPDFPSTLSRCGGCEYRLFCGDVM